MWLAFDFTMSSFRFICLIQRFLMAVGALTVLRFSVSIFLPESVSKREEQFKFDSSSDFVVSKQLAVDDADVPEHSSRVHNSAVKVFFLIGLEGTGHHVYHALVPKTPAGKVLRENKSFGTKVHRLLFRQWEVRTKGLWSSTCRWDDGREEPPPNVTEITSSLVATLRNFDNHIRSLNQTVNFHLNGKLEKGFGHLAYPNYRVPCRGLSYPNMEVWYETCDEAKVDCQHIHIFRDPHSVIKSTNINRDINHDILGSIHLYTTMLQVIHYQLLMNPSRTYACWNYDRLPSESSRLGEALMFENADDWVRVSSEVYKSRDPLTLEERRDIVPPELQPYMNSMIRVHEKVVDLCRSQMMLNTEHPGRFVK